MSDFINYIEEQREKENKVRSIEYQNWLISFLDKWKRFSDDTQDEIAKEDYKNTCLLSTFFSYIEKLAYEQNLFYEFEEDEKIFYFILKKKKCFISVLFGQGVITSVGYITEKNNKDNIHYVKVDEPVTETELKMRELVQYIIINKDYIGKIDAAKFGVHIGHACTICAIEENQTEKFKRWYKKGKLQKKIILTANTKKLEVLEKDFYSVRDLGFTEVENGTLLAVSLGIMTREEAQPFIKRLQTWKD